MHRNGRRLSQIGLRGALRILLWNRIAEAIIDAEPQLIDVLFDAEYARSSIGVGERRAMIAEIYVSHSPKTDQLPATTHSVPTPIVQPQRFVELNGSFIAEEKAVQPCF